MTNQFTKFPSIESFANVWRNHQRAMFPPTVTYGAKIKLHGTNAGVRISSTGVATQKRTGDVTPDADNFGFARWVSAEQDKWQALHDAHSDSPDQIIIFYGEWAGPGIQKEDAVSKLSQKYFFVFGMQVDDAYITDPETIEQFAPDLDRLVVLPWHITPGDKMAVNFGKRDAAEEFADYISAEAERIGAEDPFIKEMFGVQGAGEGLVLTPFVVDLDGDTYVDALSRDNVARYMFKAKSEQHRVKKTKSAATVSLKIPDDINAFVATFVTPARCEQGVFEACNGVADKRTTGDFMKWMGNDIRKEGETELDAMDYEWGDVAKHVNRAVARWYILRCDQL